MRVSGFHSSKYIFLIQHADVQIFYDISIELKNTTFLKSFNIFYQINKFATIPAFIENRNGYERCRKL